MLAHKLTKQGIRVSMRRIDKDTDTNAVDVVRVAYQRTVAVGMLVDGHCDSAPMLLDQVTLFMDYGTLGCNYGVQTNVCRKRRNNDFSQFGMFLRNGGK